MPTQPNSGWACSLPSETPAFFLISSPSICSHGVAFRASAIALCLAG